MEENKSTITLIFRIILPFWIHFPDKAVFEKEYGGINYKIRTLQNIWQVNFRSRFKVAGFLIPEKQVIDRNFYKPKINFNDINPLDLSMEEKYEEEWDYSSKKAKTILEIRFALPFMKINDDLLKFIEEECIWEDIQDLIDFFLSLYFFIKVNSNIKESQVYPLGDKYFTRENTLIYYKFGKKSEERYFEKIYLYLNIPFYSNYNTSISKKETLEYFKERFSRRNDLKMKLDERMTISIEFARKLRDMNSMIINLCIYLERISIEYLSYKKDLDNSELDILYKNKGLTHYVECQLPHFLENKVDPQIINDAIELVRNRNEIMHIGANFSFTEELESKCENTLKLIKYLKEEMESNNNKIWFEFKPELVGKTLDIGPKNQVKIIQFESKLEKDYNMRNSIDLRKIDNDLLMDRLSISNDVDSLKIPEEDKAYCKIFYKDKIIMVVFALDPTQNKLNNNLLEALLGYLDNLEIKFNNLYFYFINKHIPKGILDLFKKLAVPKLEKFCSDLQINLEYAFHSLISFSNNEDKDTFTKLSQLFNSTEKNILSKKKLLQHFDEEKIQKMFTNFPDFFERSIIDGKTYWIMHGNVELRNSD